MTAQDLPFSKKAQLKKPRKSKPDHKAEKKQAKLDQWENHDRLVYEQVAERSFDWVLGYNRCEKCGQKPAVQMHHRIPRSRGGRTETDNLSHICHDCHYKEHN